MSLKLWEINSEIERVLAEESDHTTGEITDETLEKLDALEIERDDKALQIACYLKSEIAEGLAVKTQADKLAARAKIHENRAGRLKNYLNTDSEVGKKNSNGMVQIGWQKTKSVEVLDLPKVPYDYHKVTVVDDKKKIGDALKEGIDVPGATLVNVNKIQVR